MGVDRAYVSGLEVGQRNPTIVTLWHTAEALKVPVAQLLVDGEGTATPGRRKRASKKAVARRRGIL